MFQLRNVNKQTFSNSNIFETKKKLSNNQSRVCRLFNNWNPHIGTSVYTHYAVFIHFTCAKEIMQLRSCRLGRFLGRSFPTGSNTRKSANRPLGNNKPNSETSLKLRYTSNYITCLPFVCNRTGFNFARFREKSRQLSGLGL